MQTDKLADEIEPIIRYHESGGHEGDGSDEAVARARNALAALRHAEAEQQGEATRSVPCPHCRGRSFTAFDRDLPGGGYAKTLDKVRCLDCKTELSADAFVATLSPREAEADAVERVIAGVASGLRNWAPSDAQLGFARACVKAALSPAPADDTKALLREAYRRGWLDCAEDVLTATHKDAMNEGAQNYIDADLAGDV